jgi:prepilin-type N-terminal cleavage/methylation domain-containing protein
MARPRSCPANGFTLMELLVALAVVAILAAIVFVGVSLSRRAAYRAQCTSQLRQLATALIMYRDEYGQYPPFVQLLREGGGIKPIGWERVLLPYVGSEQVFVCPADPDQALPSERWQRSSIIPSYEYLVGRMPEPDPDDSRGGSRRREARRQGALLVCRCHGSKVLVAYADGSVVYQHLPSFLGPASGD